MLNFLTALPEGSFAAVLIMALVGIAGAVLKQHLTNLSSEKLAKLANAEALEKHVQATSIHLLEELRKDLSRITTSNQSLETDKMLAQADTLIWISRARALIRHLEAILTATTPEAKERAEQHARSFLNTLPENL